MFAASSSRWKIFALSSMFVRKSGSARITLLELNHRRPFDLMATSGASVTCHLHHGVGHFLRRQADNHRHVAALAIRRLQIARRRQNRVNRHVRPERRRHVCENPGDCRRRQQRVSLDEVFVHAELRAGIGGNGWIGAAFPAHPARPFLRQCRAQLASRDVSDGELVCANAGSQKTIRARREQPMPAPAGKDGFASAGSDGFFGAALSAAAIRSASRRTAF